MRDNEDYLNVFYERLKSLPKVKYSTLTESEKLYMAHDFSTTVTEEWSCGQFTFRMNDEWYGILLRLIRDCGYDTSSVENPNWKKIEEIIPFFYDIVCKLEKRILNEMPKDDTICRQLFIEQIVMDI